MAYDHHNCTLDKPQVALDEDVEEISIEKFLQGSKLPICVIRRVLMGQWEERANQDNWLQNNIFHNQVKHQGKALNPIIDNNSGMNVIS